MLQAIAYCTRATRWTAPSEEYDWFNLSNDHMNVGTDACNGISASLGVLERYVGNAAPEAGNLSNYREQRLRGRSCGAEEGARGTTC